MRPAINTGCNLCVAYYIEYSALDVDIVGLHRYMQTRVRGRRATEIARSESTNKQLRCI